MLKVEAAYLTAFETSAEVAGESPNYTCET